MKLKQIKLDEMMLLEKHEKEKAAQMLVDAGLFSLEQATRVIDALRTEDIHAFVHAPSWMEKYLLGVARIIIEENQSGRWGSLQELLAGIVAPLESYLTWIRTPGTRTDENKDQLDNAFVKEMSLQDVINAVNNLNKEKNKESQQKLANMKFTKSDYKLVPIDSYEQMHRLYGGAKTGNGSGDSSGWCHTNGEYTYRSWVNRGDGDNKFFVLQKDGWENIPFNRESNRESHGKDEYGHSLIALLVDDAGQLLNATLRCNHEGVQGPADNQYNTYAELSELTGMNVYDEIKKYYTIPDFNQEEMFIVDGDGTFMRNARMWKAHKEECFAIESCVIPEGVKSIMYETFSGCKKLSSVKIPSSVTSIENYAFSDCTSLTSIQLPKKLSVLGCAAFRVSGLVEITIPGSLKIIEADTFNNCQNLSKVTIMEGVETIGGSAFSGCSSLKEITLPKTLKKVGSYAFDYSTVIYTDNLTLLKELQNKYRNATSKRKRSGKPYVILTEKDYIDKYGVRDGENFEQFVENVLSKLFNDYESAGDNAYKIIGADYTDEDRLQRMVSIYQLKSGVKYMDDTDESLNRRRSDIRKSNLKESQKGRPQNANRKNSQKRK